MAEVKKSLHRFRCIVKQMIVNKKAQVQELKKVGDYLAIKNSIGEFASSNGFTTLVSRMEQSLPKHTMRKLMEMFERNLTDEISTMSRKEQCKVMTSLDVELYTKECEQQRLLKIEQELNKIVRDGLKDAITEYDIRRFIDGLQKYADEHKQTFDEALMEFAIDLQPYLINFTLDHDQNIPSRDMIDQYINIACAKYNIRLHGAHYYWIAMSLSKAKTRIRNLVVSRDS
jgi:hypothetical protein